MPRGKNYVNNNRGVFLQGSLKTNKKAPVMETCFYGAACTRKDCIYRHDKDNNNNNNSKNPKAKTKSSSSDQQQQNSNRSTEPCMAFLAGVCNLPGETCRKRHPSSQQERDNLIAHFARIPCRYGSHCKTNSCLYRHDELESNINPIAPPPPVGVVVYPIASGGLPLSSSAWQPSPPPQSAMANMPMATTGSSSTSTTSTVPQTSASSAWKPTTPGGVVASAWKPVPPTSSVVIQQQQQKQQQKDSSQLQLNAQAREFKPNNGWAS